MRSFLDCPFSFVLDVLLLQMYSCRSKGGERERERCDCTAAAEFEQGAQRRLIEQK
jgi:hypothetical protein